MLNSLLHPSLYAVVSLILVLMFSGLITIGRILERMARDLIYELRRTNRYLRQICLRADIAQGADPWHWDDPGA